MALDAIAFRPRVLRDVSQVDASVSHFGRKLRLPVVLAPVGSLESFHPAGAESVVRGTGEFGAGHMLSSVCDPGLEDLAKAAPDALAALPALCPRRRGLGRRSRRARHRARLCRVRLTVDTAHYSRRERDIAKRFVTAGRRRVQGRAFQAGARLAHGRAHQEQVRHSAHRSRASPPPRTPRIAVEHGVEWIYISNHGGRQLDHGRGSIDVLPEVVEAVGGRAKILIDGSICRGSDIVKAIAAGADLVGIGRMQCFALAAGGQAGIVRLLELLEDEVQRCLGLLGVTAPCRARSFLSARRAAGQPAARAERVSAAQDRGLSVLKLGFAP